MKGENLMLTSKKKIFRLTSLILTVVLCLSLFTPIAHARASNYIFSYGASMVADGNGKVSVWFDITGTGTMDEIGSTTIIVYENGVAVKTFSYSTTPSMMTYNKHIHGSSVTYQGVAGRSYYALVIFWAAKQGAGDNRSMTTATITAK